VAEMEGLGELETLEAPMATISRYQAPTTRSARLKIWAARGGVAHLPGDASFGSIISMLSELML
jgi:hypothetical protein